LKTIFKFGQASKAPTSFYRRSGAAVVEIHREKGQGRSTRNARDELLFSSSLPKMVF
jgi:hypothetical protein